MGAESRIPDLWHRARACGAVDATGVDGAERPRALIVTTDARIIRFDDLTAEQAAAEGEGDRTLESWRREHEWFFTQHALHDRGFASDMPVVFESFRVLYRE